MQLKSFYSGAVIQLWKTPFWKNLLMGKKSSSWGGVSHSPAATAMGKRPSANLQLQRVLKWQPRGKTIFPFSDLVKSTFEAEALWAFLQHTLNLDLCDEYCYSDASTLIAVTSVESPSFSAHLDIDNCILSKELWKSFFRLVLVFCCLGGFFFLLNIIQVLVYHLV